MASMWLGIALLDVLFRQSTSPTNITKFGSYMYVWANRGDERNEGGLAYP